MANEKTAGAAALAVLGKGEARASIVRGFLAQVSLTNRSEFLGMVRVAAETVGFYASTLANCRNSLKGEHAQTVSFFPECHPFLLGECPRFDAVGSI